MAASLEDELLEPLSSLRTVSINMTLCLTLLRRVLLHSTQCHSIYLALNDWTVTDHCDTALHDHTMS